MDACSAQYGEVCLYVLVSSVMPAFVLLLPPRMSDYISLLVNMVHYNAAYLDDAIIAGLVM